MILIMIMLMMTMMIMLIMITMVIVTLLILNLKDSGGGCQRKTRLTHAKTHGEFNSSVDFEV